MAELTIPAGPDEVTSEWLTQALHTAGTISRARIASFESERIGLGQGFVGQLARFSLKYEADEQSVPRSIVGKFSSADPDLRTRNFGPIQREVAFYREIAPQIELRTPRLYHGALDRETGKSVLLLEDIVDALAGDSVVGCSVEQARLALWHLAKFHARWWESPQLDDFPWLPNINDNADRAQVSYQHAWDRFAEKVGDQLSAPFRNVAMRYGSHVAPIKDQLAARTTTILHGDYHLGNLMFGPPGSDTSLVAIDWQLMGKGPGTEDVAYFLAGEMETAQRRAAELSLLKGYHGTLVESGVRGYEFDDCQRDYRLSMFRPLQILVVAGANLDLGSELLSTLVRRVTAAMADYRMDELLSDG